MPSIKDKGTVGLIARVFRGIGKRDKGATLRFVGYAESTCISGKALNDIYGDLRVINEIARQDAKAARKVGVTVEGLLRDAIALKDHCLGPLADNPDPEAIIVDQVGANKAIDTIGKHIGFFEADNAQKTATFQQLLIRMGDGNEV